MITLVTGGPGTGKTAWLLDQLIELRKIEPYKFLFIHGVRNLRGIAHETIYCSSQLCDICRCVDIPANAKFVERWHDWKIPDSLIVVDEVQRIWRPRAGSTKPDEGVSLLETHRHYGVDFWLISQGPHLFDNFIRLLVGRHVHLVSRWSGRTQYEWPECKQDVQSRSDAVVRLYSLPIRVYSMYDSAEVHTKQDKRRPVSFYAMILLIILAVILIGFAFYRVKQRLVSVDDETLLPYVMPVPANLDSTMQTALPVIDSSVTSIDFSPRVEGRAETAPAYDGLLKVQSVPFPLQCMAWTTEKGKYCRCLTDQGTLYQMRYGLCYMYAKGEVYNPYIPPKKEEVSETPPSSLPADSTSLQLATLQTKKN